MVALEDKSISTGLVEAMMEEMANMPKEEFGKRETGDPCTYAGEREWHREFYSKYADSLQWAKDFMDRYERKHGIKK